MPFGGAKTVSLFRLPVRAETMEQAVETILHRVRQRNWSIHVVLNAAKVSMAARDPSFHRLLRRFDLIHADGFSIVLASKILGQPLPERIAGIDLMQHLLRKAVEAQLRVYFLGARQEVLEAAAVRMAADYPGLCIAGMRHGYWGKENEWQVVTTVRNSGTDMLFVGIPSPKKEEFLVRWRYDLGVSFAMGVGGAFDVMAGLVRRAPLSWQRWGMEWAYRLIQEPRRMWKRYLFTNTHFAWLLAREIARKRLCRGEETSMHFEETESQ